MEDRRTAPSVAPLIDCIEQIEKDKAEGVKALMNQLDCIFRFYDENPLKRTTDIDLIHSFGYFELVKVRLTRNHLTDEEVAMIWQWYEAGKDAVLKCYATEQKALRKSRKKRWQFWI